MRASEIITESIDVHPAELNIRDGDKFINWPKNAVRHETVPCPYCDDNGNSKHALEFGITEPCDDCFGTRQQTNTTYDFPNLNVSNSNIEFVEALMGIDGTDEFHGWIPPEQVGAVAQRLIRMKNSDLSSWARDGGESSGTVVDRSGDIPQIRKTATMIDAGMSEASIRKYIDRLLTICHWAQKNDCGVSWA